MATEGISMRLSDPEPRDTCEYQVQRKVGGRWAHVACGAAAFTVVELGGHPTHLCRSCVGRVIGEMVGLLAVADGRDHLTHGGA